MDYKELPGAAIRHSSDVGQRGQVSPLFNLKQMVSATPYQQVWPSVGGFVRGS